MPLSSFFCLDSTFFSAIGTTVWAVNVTGPGYDESIYMLITGNINNNLRGQARGGQGTLGSEAQRGNLVNLARNNIISQTFQQNDPL